MAYRNLQHCTEQEYKQIIYSGQAKNKLQISFNGVELEDADYYCEKITRISRILPNDGKKRLSLDNFVSQELEIVFHNIDETIIQDQVVISIGTVVDKDSLEDVYEYVPIGVFNIQDSPVTDKDKITIKLRDNRVKFDFNYDAKPLIDSGGGTATKKQILQDICDKAGVVQQVTIPSISSFLGEDDIVGIYDNTITGTQYISYLAEQAGAIATINRYGELIFIYLNDLITYRIPLSIVEKYELGTPFKIQRVVYEDAIRHFEKHTDNLSLTDEEFDASTLYLNAENPYISEQSQIDDIFDLLENFELDSVKTGKIIGNPVIDPWDIIEIYDDTDFYEPVIFRTLASQTFTYTGINMSEFDTQIGLEARTENVSNTGEASFRKWARTQIDNVNAEITLQAGQIEETNNNLAENYSTTGQVETLILNSANGVTNTFSEAGGNNVLRNTSFSAKSVLEEGQIYEYWYGNVVKQSNDNSINGISILLQNNTLYQTQKVANGNYTLSFYYKVVNPLATCKVIINDKEYALTATEDYTLFQTGIEPIEPIVINTNQITVGFSSTIDNACEIYDIMLNVGTVKLAYSQNQNETVTNTVNISKGITITVSDKEVQFTANNDGIRTINTRTNEEITKFTDIGMETPQAKISDSAEIVGIYRQRVGNQIWDSML